MDLLDVLIVLALILSVWHGRVVGVTRQVCATAGFVGGLFGGVFLEGKLIHLAHTASSRALLAFIVIWGSALLLLSVGEYVGAVLKFRMQRWRIDGIDGILGAFLGGATLLLSVWLGATLFRNAPLSWVQEQLQGSRIVAELDSKLPPAPHIIGKISHLIDPNGFPQVFTGIEPTPNTNAPLPNAGQLANAVEADRASVVKIEGRGCGGIVEGSGFVAAGDLVATNAHVVAGVAEPMVLDDNGEHASRVIWFDPDLDFAVLQVDNLHGKPLAIDTRSVADGTAAAALGYPGGGPFTVELATVLQSFEASGRNIYNQGETIRNVYSVHADIRPGNSGGPLIDQSGSVVGIVFAQSTTYDQVGYALAMQKVIQELHQVSSSSPTVGTGSCAE